MISMYKTTKKQLLPFSVPLSECYSLNALSQPGAEYPQPAWPWSKPYLCPFWDSKSISLTPGGHSHKQFNLYRSPDLEVSWASLERCSLLSPCLCRDRCSGSCPETVRKQGTKEQMANFIRKEEGKGRQGSPKFYKRSPKGGFLGVLFDNFNFF